MNNPTISDPLPFNEENRLLDLVVSLEKIQERSDVEYAETRQKLGQAAIVLDIQSANAYKVAEVLSSREPTNPYIDPRRGNKVSETIIGRYTYAKAMGIIARKLSLDGPNRKLLIEGRGLSLDLSNKSTRSEQENLHRKIEKHKAAQKRTVIEENTGGTHMGLGNTSQLRTKLSQQRQFTKLEKIFAESQSYTHEPTKSLNNGVTSQFDGLTGKRVMTFGEKNRIRNLIIAGKLGPREQTLLGGGSGLVSVRDARSRSAVRKERRSALRLAFTAAKPISTKKAKNIEKKYLVKHMNISYDMAHTENKLRDAHAQLESYGHENPYKTSGTDSGNYQEPVTLHSLNNTGVELRKTGDSVLHPNLSHSETRWTDFAGNKISVVSSDHDQISVTEENGLVMRTHVLSTREYEEYVAINSNGKDLSLSTFMLIKNQQRDKSTKKHSGETYLDAAEALHRLGPDIIGSSFNVNGHAVTVVEMNKHAMFVLKVIESNGSAYTIYSSPTKLLKELSAVH
ncbi:hypothetical protein H7171_04525 [Candidatus Saccharibacteria bacterium]|nr:hypothetical protein [Candidatus Saccharibacteria bacterium]